MVPRAAVLTSLFALAACGSPGEGKPKAAVEAAKANGETPDHGADALSIDAGRSKIGFVGAKVTATHGGVFEEFTGSLQIDGDVPRSIEFVVNTSSVKSESKRLDKHLRSDDFFDVERYPQAEFNSTAIVAETAAGSTHAITGNLQLHGVTKQITFPATVSMDAGSVNGAAEFTINRKDFGIEYPGRADDLIKDEVLLQIELTFPRT
jgi:polyisoprenoid-binding protein YceI